MKPNEPHPPVQNSHKKIVSSLSAATSAITPTDTGVSGTCFFKSLQNNQNLSLSHSPLFFKNTYRMIYPTGKSALRYKDTTLIYSVFSCPIKPGSSPTEQDFLNKKGKHKIGQWTGKKDKSTAASKMSDAFLSRIEFVFLPLDKGRLLRQIKDTTPFFDLILQQKDKFYLGSSLTLVRNIRAFSAWFGISDQLNQYLAHNNEFKLLSFYQHFIASATGAIIATVISNPANVIKTIKQVQSINHQTSTPAKRMAYQKWHEIQRLGRGLIPRFMFIVPRLTLLKAMNDVLKPIIEEETDKPNARKNF